MELPIWLSSSNSLCTLGLCISKSTTNTFLPELANILARFKVVNVFPSPGWMEVIRNDLNALSELESLFIKKFMEVRIALSDSTNVSLDLILIFKILSKSFNNGRPPNTGILVKSLNSFTWDIFSKNNLIMIEIIIDKRKPTEIKITTFKLSLPPTIPTVLAFSITFVWGTIPDLAMDVFALFSSKNSYNFSFTSSFLFIEAKSLWERGIFLTKDS